MPRNTIVLRSAATAALAFALFCGLLYPSAEPGRGVATVPTNVSSLAFISAASAASTLSSPTAADVAVALHRTGLQPEALAASGASATDVSALVAAFKTALSGSTLGQADAQLATARKQHDSLRRKVESGVATSEEAASFPGAAEQLTLASAQQATELDELFDAATTVLASAQRNVLAMIRENRAAWDQEWPYLAAPLDQQQRVALRDALANERISAEAGESPDPDAQALLQGVRAMPQVAAAMASFDANLAEVRQAWEASIL